MLVPSYRSLVMGAREGVGPARWLESLGHIDIRGVGKQACHQSTRFRSIRTAGDTCSAQALELAAQASRGPGRLTDIDELCGSRHVHPQERARMRAM